jgi:small-conductance mechanosensitive channel
VVGKGPVVIVAVILFLLLGWFISRDLSRVATTLFKRMDPATAGTVGFVIRFLAVAATALSALAVAQVSLTALAVGGSFTAIILGMAAQQTLGNVFAGMVLLSAQPFRLGQRIRLQAGATGGQLEGVVSSLGLLYTTLARGQDRILIPNNVVIQAVIVPLREPTPVDVRIKLREGVRPTQVQAILDQELASETRTTPSVVLEEIDGDTTIIRVRATPEDADDQARLADAIITVLANVTGEHEVQRAS